MLMKCPIAIFNNFKQGPALGDVGKYEVYKINLMEVSKYTQDILNN